MRKTQLKKNSAAMLMFLLVLFLFCGFRSTGGVNVEPGAQSVTVSESLVDSDGWDLSTLDTARDVSYLSDVEKDVILELNKARTNPKKYAELYIRPRLSWFLDSPGETHLYIIPGETIYRATREGRKSIQECIADMSRRRAMRPLAVSEGLSRAARDHVEDTGPKGISAHRGSDGSDPSGRAKRYGLYSCGENISFGKSTAQDILIQLLVDDGVPGRGHRQNCFDTRYTIVGTAVGDHAKSGTMCVIDFYWETM
jgi:uncharacterized protein YkwD